MKTTDLSRVIGAIPDLPDYEDREKSTLAERDAEIARLHAENADLKTQIQKMHDNGLGESWIEQSEAHALRVRIAKLEAAQVWRPASEPPNNEQSVEVQFANGHCNTDFFNHDHHMWVIHRDAVIRWRELPPTPQETPADAGKEM